MHLDILMPDPAYRELDALVSARLTRYRTALAPHDLELVPVPWTQASPQRPALALLAWGYHLQAERWQVFLNRWPEAVPLLNPAPLLRWNTDKIYLEALERAGVKVVPTRFVARADGAARRTAAAQFGCDRLIVKPRISASAYRTLRLGAADPAEPLANAVLQPFLSAIADEGEYSLVYFAGRFSHAVLKRPAPGDFRIHEEYGGTCAARAPDAQALAVGDSALAALPGPAAYARVDLIRGPDQGLCLLELELIEPDLFLDDPVADGRFAAAIQAALHMDRNSNP